MLEDSLQAQPAMMPKEGATMGDKRLAHVLIDLGFFSALGTTEFDGTLVRKGEEFTWDTNNGVTVVFDQIGRPWIKRTSQVSHETMTELITAFGLERGARVPHSNDGGHFILETLPSL
jgi:hypothetical protein